MKIRGGNKMKFGIILALLFALCVPSAALGGLSDNPQVIMETSKGTIVLEVFPDEAPETVKNFLQYVRWGHYDGTIFHRVIPDFMIQGGGFTPDMKRKQTEMPVQNEANNGLKNKRGTVAMARTPDPHSATDQFFINTKSNGFLNHKDTTPQGWGYAVFGKVIKGMDVVDAISGVKTGKKGMMGDVPVEPVKIIKMTIKE
jgi:peptidyl-prolyl cis-trans isomerase B (cyclophilin B)